jgi:hypothetical protein
LNVSAASAAIFVLQSFQATMKREKWSSACGKQNLPQPITFR